MRLLYVLAAHVKSIQPAAIGYEERGVRNIGPPSTYANAHNPLPDQAASLLCNAVCAVFLTAF